MRKIRDILFRSNGFGCTSDIKSLNYGVCLISLVVVSRKIESSLLGNPFLNIIKKWRLQHYKNDPNSFSNFIIKLHHSSIHILSHLWNVIETSKNIFHIPIKGSLKINKLYHRHITLTSTKFCRKIRTKNRNFRWTRSRKLKIYC